MLALGQKSFLPFFETCYRFLLSKQDPAQIRETYHEAKQIDHLRQYMKLVPGPFCNKMYLLILER